MAVPPKKAETVKVIVRCRPLNSTEKKQGHNVIVEMDSKRGVINIRNPNDKNEVPRNFTFDSVYDSNSKQQDLYTETFHSLVQSVLDGFNGTIFAYGQTGTGKTHTMQGLKNNPDEQGVIPNSFDHIFNHIQRSSEQQYLVRASYLEIYQEDIRDLLAKDQHKRLELKERPDTGIYVKDLSSFVTKNVKEIDHVMNVGNANRSVGSTNMNEQSSRSHAIFIVTIECSEMGVDKEQHIRAGKLNMVDLAGSERQAKTGAEGTRLKEATKINLSLSALGNVISALVDGKSSHIPYRDSKLTRLLQDSLGGNARTVMVANIGPASYNFDETINTLRYANRAKNIKNQPKINEDPKDALLREFQEELVRLRAHLEAKGGGVTLTPGGGGGAGLNSETAELEAEKDRIMADKSMVESERDRLLGQVDERRVQLAREEENAAKLRQQIKAMEGKLLSGGGDDIQDHTDQQKRALEQQQRELAEQAALEREAEQKLLEQEETVQELNQTFSSMQAEVDAKTKKLKKLFAKLQLTKQEISEVQNTNQREREELAETQHLLMKELKLKQVIIENFVPPDERTRLMGRAEYDEDEENWVLQPIGSGTSLLPRPISASGHKRPVSEHAKVSSQLCSNPRYRHENILLLELDFPVRTTRDYEGPTVAPQVQAALDAALQDEEDIEIQAAPRSGKRRTAAAGAARKASASAKKPQNTEQFPVSRGLVPK